LRWPKLSTRKFSAWKKKKKKKKKKKGEGGGGIHNTLKRYLFRKTKWSKITIDGKPYKFM